MIYLKPPIIIAICFAMTFFFDYLLRSVFNIKGDLNTFLSIGLTIIVSYCLYKIYMLLKSANDAGITSPTKIIFHKENIHEINFKAQFANFKKKYEKEINSEDLNSYGKEFEKLINNVEAKLLTISRNPNNMPNNINYYNITIDQIMLALLDAVRYGHFIYRGMPAYETAYFIKMYQKILEDEYRAGTVTAEEKKNALDNLNYEVKNNG